MNKERHPLAGETLRYTSSGNHDTVWLPKPQKKAPVMRPSGPDTMLNSESAGIVASRGSQDVRAQLIFLLTIYSILSILTLIISRWPKSRRRKYLGKNIEDLLWKKTIRLLKEKKRERIKWWYIYALKRED